MDQHQSANHMPDVEEAANRNERRSTGITNSQSNSLLLDSTLNSSQPDYFHPETIVGLASSLLTSHGHLDEDSLTSHMVHIHKVTADRIRYDALLNDSEEDDGYDQVYEQEEELALAQYYFKQAVTVAQQTISLDKRTLNWVRKEMGLGRRESFASRVARSMDQSDESTRSDEQPRKRFTRTQARNTRFKKREQRSAKENQGLKNLFTAVQELELESRTSFGDIEMELATSQNEASSNRGTKDPISGGYESDTEIPKVKGTSPKRKNISKRKKRLAHKSAENQELPESANVKTTLRTPTKGTMIDDKAPRTPKRQRLSPSIDRLPSTKSNIAYLASPKAATFRSPKGIPKVSRNVKSPKSETGRTPSKRDADISTPISLSLLEWRRRHQWTPSKDQRTVGKLKIDYIDEDEEDDEIRPRILDEDIPEITIPGSYKEEGIDLRLPTWELCNPVGQIALGEPPVSEPNRLVYTNDKYASWCTKMINSLTGGARCWARYEFFYSDLDRPWFNFHEFQIDLAKHGISPSVKLTRREWSAVRKAIWRKPRLFSRKFIQEQVNELNSYRHTVRMMQHSGVPKPPNFKYEVHAAIKVGNVVTAFNRRFRILQRGTVLLYDVRRKMYLIQFERKEVGFEFVPDSDVTAHGLPELLHAASEVALDETLIGGFADRNNGIGSMLYGTMYGRNSVHRVNQPPLIRGLAINDDSSFARANHQEEHVPLLHENTYLRPFLNTALVEKVAEREIVTKLVEFIDKAMKRKLVLLEAIDFLNKQVASVYPSDPSGYSNANPEFKQHYAWLMSNYEVTTECLDSLMIHLQVMYGRGYAGRGGALCDVSNNRIAAEKALARVNMEQPLDPCLSAPWLRAISIATRSAAELLPCTKSGEGPELSYIEKLSRQQLAAQLLMATEYTASLAGDVQFGSCIGTPVAAANVLKKQLELLSNVQLPFYTGASPAMHSASDKHAAAIRELEGAIGSLSAEIAAMHATTSLQAKHTATYAA